MESQDGVDVSTIRVFKRCDTEFRKAAILYFKVKSGSKTEDIRLRHRLYGFLEKGEGELDRYLKAIVGFDRLEDELSFEPLDQCEENALEYLSLSVKHELASKEQLDC